MKNHNTFIAWLTSVLVLIVAGISFTLSYHALQGVALANGLTGWLSLIWPLLVDFSLVVFSLCVVSAHLYSESTWKQWVLVSISTLLTVFYNALYAYPEMLPALASKLLVIGLPPIMLFFSFELLMSQLKNGIKRSQQQATITGYDNALQIAQNGFSELMAQVESIKAQHTITLQERDNRLAELSTQLEAALDPVGIRRKSIVSTLQIDPMITYKALAGEHQVSTQTIQNDLVKLTESGAIHRNGSGWQVMQ